MNKAFLYLVCLCFFTDSFAQQSDGFSYNSSEGQIKKLISIDFSKLGPDINFSVLPAGTSAPKPSGTDYHILKAEIDSKRALRKKKINLSKANAVPPAPTFLRSYTGNSVNSTPNDNSMGISNSGIVVSVANTNIRIFNDTGALIFSKSLTMFPTGLPALTRSYDPRVIYDPLNDRFIAVWLEGAQDSAYSRIILAFTSSSDPVGIWNFYEVSGNYLNNGTWSDYPIISISKEELFMTFNSLRHNMGWKDGFTESIIWQIDKSKGYNGQSLAFKFYNNIKYLNVPIWSICPVQGGSEPKGPNMYFLSVRPTDFQNDSIFVHEISNTIASGNATLSSKVVRSNKLYGLPPSAIQPNNNLVETNDARVLSAMYENGIIQFVGNSIDTNNFSPGIYHGVVHDPSASNTTISGRIISYDTLDLGYPSIAYAGGGGSDESSMITILHVSTITFPGTSVIYLDRNYQPSSLLRIKAGQNNFMVLADTQRWGDYTGIQRKYNEVGVIALNGMFAEQTGQNRTWIARLKNADPKLGAADKWVENKSWIVYPNPAQERITMEYNSESEGFVSYKIIDVNGREYYSVEKALTRKGLNYIQFNTSGFPSGIYFLNIVNNSKSESKKFSVVH